MFPPSMRQRLALLPRYMMLRLRFVTISRQKNRYMFGRETCTCSYNKNKKIYFFIIIIFVIIFISKH